MSAPWFQVKRTRHTVAVLIDLIDAPMCRVSSTVYRPEQASFTYEDGVRVGGGITTYGGVYECRGQKRMKGGLRSYVLYPDMHPWLIPIVEAMDQAYYVETPEERATLPLQRQPDPEELSV